MVDLILFSFAIGTFVAGFWCGKTYGTFTAMKAAVAAKAKSWF